MHKWCGNQLTNIIQPQDASFVKCNPIFRYIYVYTHVHFLICTFMWLCLPAKVFTSKLIISYIWYLHIKSLTTKSTKSQHNWLLCLPQPDCWLVRSAGRTFESDQCQRILKTLTSNANFGYSITIYWNLKCTEKNSVVLFCWILWSQQHCLADSYTLQC